jgi:hypothetical protein
MPDFPERQGAKKLASKGDAPAGRHARLRFCNKKADDTIFSRASQRFTKNQSLALIGTVNQTVITILFSDRPNLLHKIKA